jgi:tungstate transport system permease protein
MKEAVRLLFSGDPETWATVLRSLAFSLFSTVLSLVPGLLVGIALSAKGLPGRRALIAIVNALTALPTVVIGLIVYMLISRSGPLGYLHLLYSPAGIVFGQTFLAFPIVASLTCAGLSKLDPRFRETLVTLGAGPAARFAATMRESRQLIVAAVVTAFGRVTGEVGVCTMLGGNIKGVTRTMTTTIALDIGLGDYERALALGMVLLSIAVAINLILHALVPRDA